MQTIRINDRISYIECTENPLSADIGIVESNGIKWLFDLGNNEKAISELDDTYNVVLSHFHIDHVGNAGKISCAKIFGSKETAAHVNGTTVVNEDLVCGNLRIFTIPSSHCKGCLGLEIDGLYAFVGDALYSKRKDNFHVYNSQLLKAEIEKLESLSAKYLLVSHYKGLVRKKEEVIADLKRIYGFRSKNECEIRIPIITR